MEERRKPSAELGVYAMLIVAGLVLLAASLVWPRLDDGRSTWTEEKSAAYQEVSARLHGLSFRDRNDEEIKKQLDQAQSEYQTLNAQLQAARTRGTRTAFWLKVIGGVLAAIGSVGYFMQRKAHNS